MRIRTKQQIGGIPLEAQGFLGQHTQLLIESYNRLLSEPLIATEEDKVVAQALWQAPFAVVSHNTDVEPVFNYANLKALSLFEFSWDEFTRLPSRYSAEPINQPGREALLAAVKAQGFIRDYHGVRLSKTGRRFEIKHAVVWNLFDQNDRYCGQAACFKEWRYL